MTALNWSQSGCEIVKTEYEWNVQIPFLKTRDGNGEDLLCDSFFYAKETPDHLWAMQVNDIIDYIQISVWHFNSKKQSTIIGDPAVLVKFAVVDRQGQKGFQQMLPSHSNAKYVLFTLRKSALIDSKCQLADGSLTFYCKIQSFVRVGTDLWKPKFSNAKPVNYSDQLITQLEEMLSDTRLSDVTFVIGSRQFKAHKTILATRSKVFEAMFAHQTSENLTNRVVIEDIEPDVFRVLLHFIYTGRVSLAEMGKFAARLYTAADKYLLDQLKSACENHLIRRPMSADKCFELLLFTNDHPVEQLKQAAINYFRLFPIEVMDTDGWKKAQQQNLPLVTKIFHVLLHPADVVDVPQVDQVKEESSSKKMRLESS